MHHYRLRPNDFLLAAAVLWIGVSPQNARAQWADCSTAPAGTILCVSGGNVGIGTTLPTAPLSVVGNAVFNFNRYGGLNHVTIRGYHSNANYGVFDFSTLNDASTPADVNVAEMVGVINSHMAGSEAGSFAFSTRNNGTMAEVMRLANTGNVGIGTPNPQTALHVNSAAVTQVTSETTAPTGYAQFRVKGDSKVYQLSVGGSATAFPGMFYLWDETASAARLLVNSAGNLGIGTVSPATVLDVNGTIRSTAQTVPTSGAGTEVLYTAGNGYVTAFDRSASAWKPLHVNGAFLTLNALSGGNVGIGTAAPTRKLDVNGTIGVREVVVTNTGWADFVFKPGYKLSSLSEVAAFIKDNGHLPEIPSETEVKQNGVSMGEMQSKLLAKIEELTLHMIQAEESNKRLENQNRVLQRQVEELAQLVGKQR